MGAAELRCMHDDYRRTAADLAYAQTHFAGTRTAVHLNQLVGSAHAELYGASPRRASAIWRFLAIEYPRLVRRNWKPMAISAGLLFGSVALGYLLAHVNYPLARIFIPEGLRDGIGDSIAQGQDVRDMIANFAPAITAGITVNNIQVSFTAFAGGMTFGALTVYALVTNGLLLGVLGGVFATAGESLYFWSLIVPHGSLELPAIVLAGGAGLMLARSLLFPGDLPRMASLRAASGDAAKAVLGVIPLLIVAGIIEGFVTPTGIDPVVKMGFGAVMFALLSAYILLPGRNRN
jgi:uncharacterized membrane protein SpoIIM required for sporulation